MIKKETKLQWAELRTMLNEWDPIGGCPEDEYDCFIGPIIKILQKDQGKGELTNFLISHLEEHMGLQAKHHKPDEFAEKLLNWWNR